MEPIPKPDLSPVHFIKAKKCAEKKNGVKKLMKVQQAGHPPAVA